MITQIEPTEATIDQTLLGQITGQIKKSEEIEIELDWSSDEGVYTDLCIITTSDFNIDFILEARASSRQTFRGSYNAPSEFENQYSVPELFELNISDHSGEEIIMKESELDEISKEVISKITIK